MDSVAQMPIPEDWGRPYASLTERNAGTGYPLRNVLATNGSRRGSLIYGAPHRRIRDGLSGGHPCRVMAELGHDVVGVDVDELKLKDLRNGEAPFFEPNLDEILRRNLEPGRLRFTSSYEEAAEFADTHFIGVATPQKRGEFAADLRYVEAVIETLARL